MKPVAEASCIRMQTPVPPGRTAFVDALLDWRQAGRAPVIAEIKLMSLKHGPLVERCDVENRVAAYEAGGAACLSVVTGHWYGGDLDLLRQVRQLTTRPLLRKDFITSRRMIDESREGGADAVLLTKRLLSSVTLNSLASYALDLGVTPFVEVADEHELKHVALPDGAVLAINNRDIRNGEVGNQGVESSLAMQRMTAGCRPAAWVSASGIDGPADIAALVAAGFDAALVATALLRCDDPEGFLCAARERSINVHKVVQRREGPGRHIHPAVANNARPYQPTSTGAIPE